MTTSKNNSKATLEDLDACVEKGGFLETGKEFSFGILKHAGFKVVETKTAIFLTGTNPETTNLLNETRKNLLKEKDINEELLPALAKQNPGIVNALLPYIKVIFANGFLITHFAKASIYEETKEGVWNNFRGKFDDWNRQSVKIGVPFYFEKILDDLSLKHLITLTKNILKDLDNKFNSKEYSTIPYTSLFKIPPLAHHDLCVYEIVSSENDGSLEHEWILKEQLGLHKVTYPYLLCAKKNIGDVNHPEISVKAGFKTLKDAYQAHLTSSNRTVVIINDNEDSNLTFLDDQSFQEDYRLTAIGLKYISPLRCVADFKI